MLPSKRIRQIAEEIFNQNKGTVYIHVNSITELNGIYATDLRIESMTRYLDEEYNSECQHKFVYMTEGDGVGDALLAVERCTYCGERKSNGNH